MDKIYGYKTNDIIRLAEFLKDRGNSSLTSTFSAYGKLYGKAKGTVRNLYYALAKRSNEDSEFCNKYLQGTPIKVSKVVEFDKDEEKELIKQILLAKKSGRSVRSAIMEMASGDGKLALRYQNKFRNALKNDANLVSQVIEELKQNGQEVNVSFPKEKSDVIELDVVQVKKLKTEINNLVGKIALKVRKENQFLKDRIVALERENLKLLKLLYGENKSMSVRKFFGSNTKEETFLN